MKKLDELRKLIEENGSVSKFLGLMLDSESTYFVKFSGATQDPLKSLIVETIHDAGVRPDLTADEKELISGVILETVDETIMKMAKNQGTVRRSNRFFKELYAKMNESDQFSAIVASYMQDTMMDDLAKETSDGNLLAAIAMWIVCRSVLIPIVPIGETSQEVHVEQDTPVEEKKETSGTVIDAEVVDGKVIEVPLLTEEETKKEEKVEEVKSETKSEPVKEEGLESIIQKFASGLLHELESSGKVVDMGTITSSLETILKAATSTEKKEGGTVTTSASTAYKDETEEKKEEPKKQEEKKMTFSEVTEQFKKYASAIPHLIDDAEDDERGQVDKILTKYASSVASYMGSLGIVKRITDWGKDHEMLHENLIESAEVYASFDLSTRFSGAYDLKSKDGVKFTDDGKMVILKLASMDENVMECENTISPIRLEESLDDDKINSILATLYFARNISDMGMRKKLVGYMYDNPYIVEDINKIIDMKNVDDLDGLHRLVEFVFQYIDSVVNPEDDDTECSSFEEAIRGRENDPFLRMVSLSHKLSRDLLKSFSPKVEKVESAD